MHIFVRYAYAQDQWRLLLEYHKGIQRESSTRHGGLGFASCRRARNNYGIDYMRFTKVRLSFSFRNVIIRLLDSYCALLSFSILLDLVPHHFGKGITRQKENVVKAKHLYGKVVAAYQPSEIK